MDKFSTHQGKMRFHDICIAYHIDNQGLQVIAEGAGVAKSIVDTMFAGTAVEGGSAQKVLAVLSHCTGQLWTLKTADVPVIEGVSINEFERYLLQHNIDPYHLYRVAEVRYQTVYNAIKGNPITTGNAQKIKDALLALTGVAYDGPFVLIQEESPQFLPSRIKKIPRNHHHS